MFLVGDSGRKKLSNRWLPILQFKTSKASCCAGHDTSQFLQAVLFAELSGRYFQIVSGRFGVRCVLHAVSWRVLQLTPVEDFSNLCSHSPEKFMGGDTEWKKATKGQNAIEQLGSLLPSFHFAF
jgi:hypothetical protein